MTVKKYTLSYIATTSVIADSPNKARELVAKDIQYIHPKWKMKWDSMSIEEINNEETI